MENIDQDTPASGVELLLKESLDCANKYEAEYGATYRALQARIAALIREHNLCCDALRQPRMCLANALVYLGRFVEQVVNERRLVLLVREQDNDATFISALLSHFNDECRDPSVRMVTEDALVTESAEFRRLVAFIRANVSVHDFSGRVLAHGSHIDTVSLPCSVQVPFDDYETDEVRAMWPNNDELPVDITFTEANITYPGGISTFFARYDMQRIVERDRHLRNPIAHAPAFPFSHDTATSNTDIVGAVTIPFDFDFNGYVYREHQPHTAVLADESYEYHSLDDDDDDDDDDTAS